MLSFSGNGWPSNFNSFPATREFLPTPLHSCPELTEGLPAAAAVVGIRVEHHQAATLWHPSICSVRICCRLDLRMTYYSFFQWQNGLLIREVLSGNNNGSGLDQRKLIPSIYPDFPWPPLTEVSEPDYIKTSTKGKAVLQSFYTVSIGLCVVVLDLIQATATVSRMLCHASPTIGICPKAFVLFHLQNVNNSKPQVIELECKDLSLIKTEPIQLLDQLEYYWTYLHCFWGFGLPDSN